MPKPLPEIVALTDVEADVLAIGTEHGVDVDEPLEVESRRMWHRWPRNVGTQCDAWVLNPPARNSASLRVDDGIANP